MAAPNKRRWWGSPLQWSTIIIIEDMSTLYLTILCGL